MTFQVDLNSDLGESFGAWKTGNDAEILRYISSANVACGYHAGDPVVMEKTVRIAVEKGVAVGAHPGYPDLQGFGRRKMSLPPDTVTQMVTYQLGALDAFLRPYGKKLQHVSPHGAMGNSCQYDRELSSAICKAVANFDPSIIVFYCAGAVLGEEARNYGLQSKCEIFADRAYLDDLCLVPRSQPGAMITDENLAIERCIQMVKEGTVQTLSGKTVEIAGDTLCVHGDGPKALEFVRKIRSAFEESGITIRNFQ